MRTAAIITLKRRFLLQGSSPIEPSPSLSLSLSVLQMHACGAALVMHEHARARADALDGYCLALGSDKTLLRIIGSLRNNVPLDLRLCAVGVPVAVGSTIAVDVCIRVVFGLLDARGTGYERDRRHSLFVPQRIGVPLHRKLFGLHITLTVNIRAPAGDRHVLALADRR